MPVQVPILQRDEAPTDASVGRIDYKQPDLATPIAQEGQAIEGATSEIGKVVKAQKIFAGQNAANEARATFRAGHDNALNGNPGQVDPTTGAQISPPELGAKQKAQTNDPSQVFAQFDNQMQSLKDSVASKWKDADPIVQAHVSQVLNDEARRGYNISNTAYHVAQGAYVDRTSKAAVDMNNQDMATAAGNVDKIQQDDAENPNVQNPIDKALLANRMALGNKFMQKGGGGVVPITDPNDKSDVPAIVDYKFVSNEAKAELKKANSQGVSGAIKSTLIPGQSTDNAQYLYDKYGDQLDNTHKPQIQDALAKASIEQKSNDAFNEVSQLPYTNAMKKLSDVDDDQVRAGAMKKLSTYRTQMEAAQTSQAKDNFIAAGQIVYKQQQSGQPFHTKDQALSDPRVAPYLDRLTPEQLKAVGSLVEPPDKSDPVALNKAFDLMKNGSTDLKGMSVPDLVLAKSQLDKKNADLLQSEYNKWNVTTPSDLTKQSASVNEIIEDQMLELGKTNRDLGIKKNSYNEYSPADVLKLNTMKQKWYGEADTVPAMSNKDQQAHVQGMISDLVKNQVVPTSLFDSFINKAKSFLPSSSSPAPKETPSPTTSNVPGVTSSASSLKLKMDALQRFQKVNGRVPDLSSPTGKKELNDFIDSGK